MIMMMIIIIIKFDLFQNPMHTKNREHNTVITPFNRLYFKFSKRNSFKRVCIYKANKTTNDNRRIFSTKPLSPEFFIYDTVKGAKFTVQTVVNKYIMY